MDVSIPSVTAALILKDFYLKVRTFFISSSSNSSSSSDDDDWSASEGDGEGSAFRSGDFSTSLLFGAIFDGFLEVDSFLFAKNFANSSAPSFSMNSAGSQVSSQACPSSFNPAHFTKYCLSLLNNEELERVVYPVNQTVAKKITLLL